MRAGFRVYDSDTHVNPAADVLERYVEPDFRPRLAELAPFRIPTRGNSAQNGGTPGTSQYRVHFRAFRRVLGEARPPEVSGGKGSEDGSVWMGSKRPRQGTQDDQSANRIQDMDDEGTDTHFLIPTAWLSVSGADDVALESGLIRAYHRHSADFCAPYPDRLKTMIVACTRDVGEAVREIHRWGDSKWAVAVMPLLHQDIPLDHPDLEPIWKAAADHDLAVVHHSNTWAPPYFPGYRDLWDNIFLGRMASHPWGGMRFMAAFIGAGILDRYPALRMGVLECGFGWLPFWSKRMDEQANYVGGVAKLLHRPSEYVTGGRFFCSVEVHEGEEMFRYVSGVLGEDVLMFGSDYPHSECQFPNSVDNILGWSSLAEGARRKLLWDNASRLYKQT